MVPCRPGGAQGANETCNGASAGTGTLCSGLGVHVPRAKTSGAARESGRERVAGGVTVVGKCVGKSSASCGPKRSAERTGLCGREGQLFHARGLVHTGSRANVLGGVKLD